MYTGDIKGKVSKKTSCIQKPLEDENHQNSNLLYVPSFEVCQFGTTKEFNF